MWEYDIEYAESKAENHNIYIVRRPSIPAPKKNYSEYDIQGRDGLLYIDEETVDDIEIRVEMNFMGKQDEWFGYWRGAKKWLLQKGQNRLSFGDDTDYFYLVKKVMISEAERVCYEIGRFTATFFCYGYQYLQEGWRKYKYERRLYNPYETSHPSYFISGEGTCTLTVNGKSLSANVGQNLTINTEMMIAYRTDGTLMNTAVKGNYEDLYLKAGDNEIGITDGFSLEVMPCWRCI